VIDTVALLLADRSPALRRLALLEVDGAPADDPEVAALAAEVPASPEVAAALAAPAENLTQLSFTLCRLAHLGLGRGHPAVEERAERLFSAQRGDGSWPFERAWGGAPRVGGRVPAGEGYEWRPLQTALPLRGLAAAGFATDPRAEGAYEWLLDHRMEDGSWPYGKAAGQRPGAVVGYRRLPRSEGCRNTTTGALACFAHHPERRLSVEARGALDLLLQRETREEATLGHEVARLLGAEPPRGFATFYARFDLAFILELASRMGAAPTDPRLADLISFLETLRGPHGLWEHPSHPHLSRWLTLDLLASLERLHQGDWTGSDLRSGFRPYPGRRRRY
jgi:hypothetical protein